MLKNTRLRDGTALALAIALPIVGCASPSQRIATSLTSYGMDAGEARCIGDRLERNLSVGQLQQLGRAARAYSRNDTSPGRLTGSDLVRVSSQLKDIKVPVEVGKAALGCGVLVGGASL